MAFVVVLAVLVAVALRMRTVALAGGPPAPAASRAAQQFGQKCAGCHGANGGGGLGPSLAGVAAKGDDFIHARIQNGSPTKGMPAFGESLDPDDFAELVRYVKGL